MNNFKRTASIWNDIFIRKKYVIVSIVFAIIFYFLNVLISNFWNIIYGFKENEFTKAVIFSFSLIINFNKTILPFSFYTLVILSVLTGILVSLMVYNFNSIKKTNAGILTSTSIFLGILAPGCASCGIGLVGLFGLASSFTTLPFQGKEISLIAISLVTFSIIRTSYKMSVKSCNINFYEMKGGNKK